MRAAGVRLGLSATADCLLALGIVPTLDSGDHLSLWNVQLQYAHREGTME